MSIIITCTTCRGDFPNDDMFLGAAGPVCTACDAEASSTARNGVFGTLSSASRLAAISALAALFLHLRITTPEASFDLAFLIALVAIPAAVKALAEVRRGLATDRDVAYQPRSNAAPKKRDRAAR